MAEKHRKGIYSLTIVQRGARKDADEFNLNIYSISLIHLTGQHNTTHTYTLEHGAERREWFAAHEELDKSGGTICGHQLGVIDIGRGQIHTI
jgi:hypothetical protein